LLDCYFEKYPTLVVQSDKKRILAEIKDYEGRLSHCRDLLATKQIDPEDYREMKITYGGKITQLESKLTEANNEWEELSALISLGVEKVIVMRQGFDAGEFLNMRKAFGSMYPKKAYFQETQVRTTRRNGFVESINLIYKELDKNKNGTKMDFSTLSRQVGVAGFEPATSWSQTRRDDRATLHPE